MAVPIQPRAQYLSSRHMDLGWLPGNSLIPFLSLKFPVSVRERVQSMCSEATSRSHILSTGALRKQDLNEI